MKKENKQIVKAETQAIDPRKREKLDLEVWTKQFNAEPDADAVKINKVANNTAYLPISHIENLLDKYFFGLWSTSDFTYQNIANELVGSIELRVRHPLTGEVITRTGVGGVQVRVNKETGKKVTNALVADVPHLKAECIKNAAKSIGKVFGRDIGRKSEDVDEFDTLLEKQEKIKNQDSQLFEEEIVGEEVTESETNIFEE